jgi:hypothetical protein
MTINHIDVSLVVKIITGLIIFSVIAYVGWKLEKSHLIELESKEKQEQEKLAKSFETDLNS